jgi:hypothetical protein
MKKILSFLAMTASILMISSVVSCNKNNNEEEEENNGNAEYVAPIKIDGDFSDWAKLDGTKIASATCDAEAVKNALKVVKVYADAVYVFVYFEWDKDQISHQPESAPGAEDNEDVPFHVYLNVDGDAKTGGYGDQFTDACTDILFEGFIYPGGSSIGSYEPGLFEWTGEPNASGWSWADLGEFNNLTAGAGIEGKYEFQIARELLPKKLADTFSIGFDIQQGWDSVGILPNSHVTEDNPGGLAPSLQVTTVK